MEIVAYIIAVIFALIVTFFLFTIISYDIKQAKRYRTADRCQGIVLEKLGTEETAAYGRNQRRKYNQYQIQFSDEKETYTDVLLMKNKELEAGDVVEVRYVTDKKGVHLINDVSLRRLKEVIISLIIVIPLCVFFIYLKENGMM